MNLILIVAVVVAGSGAFVAAQQCGDFDFTCDNGDCLPSQWHCDYFHDCDDSSDERGCPCENGFICQNTDICISRSWVCDTHDDCGDGSDEVDCPPPTSSVPPTEGPCVGFECLDGSGCIPVRYWCNNYPDCVDGSDEADCPCWNNEMTCDDGGCTHQDHWCDGIEGDCDDGSDELHCDNSTLPSGSRIHRTGLDKVFKSTSEGKRDKVRYQQKLRSQRNNKLRKSAMA